MVVAGVHGDSIKPRREVGVAPELVNFAKHGEECVLDGIEGGLTVAHETDRDGEYPVLVTSHEFVECSFVALENPIDQVAVVTCRQCHEANDRPARIRV